MVVWRSGLVEVARKVLGNARDHYTAVDVATSQGMTRPQLATQQFLAFSIISIYLYW